MGGSNHRVLSPKLPITEGHICTSLLLCVYGIMVFLIERPGNTPEPLDNSGNLPLEPLSDTGIPSHGDAAYARFSMRNLSPGPRWVGYGVAIYVAGEISNSNSARETAITIIALGVTEVIHHLHFTKRSRQ